MYSDELYVLLENKAKEFAGLGETSALLDKHFNQIANTAKILKEERDALHARVAELEANQSTCDQKTEKPISVKEETTYLNIIGGLLKLLCNEKLTTGQPKWRETDIIQKFGVDYPNKQGLKKRTLEEKFSEAKKSLDSS
jgi:hypothetical protein